MNQLFKKKPTYEFVKKVALLYNIQEFKETEKFTLNYLDNFKTVDKLNEIKSELCEYYINCKAKKYLENLDSKKAITVLRQLLKSINYNIISKEKYRNGSKYLEFHIDKFYKKPKNKKKIIMTFD